MIHCLGHTGNQMRPDLNRDALTLFLPQHKIYFSDLFFFLRKKIPGPGSPIPGASVHVQAEEPSQNLVSCCHGYHVAYIASHLSLSLQFAFLFVSMNVLEIIR